MLPVLLELVETAPEEEIEDEEEEGVAESEGPPVKLRSEFGCRNLSDLVSNPAPRVITLGVCSEGEVDGEDEDCLDSSSSLRSFTRE